MLSHRKDTDMLGKAVGFLVVALLVGVLAARVLDTKSKSIASSGAMAAATVSPPSVPSNSRSFALSRGNGGHFWVDARIDGRRPEQPRLHCVRATQRGSASTRQRGITTSK